MDSATLKNFSWIRKGKVAGMGFPHHPEAASHELKRLGVTAVLTLTESPVTILQKEMEEYFHYPLQDFSSPTTRDIQTCIQWMESNQGKGIAVHCYGGYGRTGTILASWLVAKEGYTALDAIAEIRRLRPHSIETTGQENSVKDFANYQAQLQDES